MSEWVTGNGFGDNQAYICAGLFHDWKKPGTLAYLDFQVILTSGVGWLVYGVFLAWNINNNAVRKPLFLTACKVAQLFRPMSPYKADTSRVLFPFSWKLHLFLYMYLNWTSLTSYLTLPDVKEVNYRKWCSFAVLYYCDHDRPRAYYDFYTKWYYSYNV